MRKLIVLITLLFTSNFIVAQWVNQTVPNTGAELHSIDFLNSNTGFVGGGDFGPSVIIKTTNGGTNWNTSYVPNGNVVAIKMIDSNIIYAVTNSAQFLKSTNGGTNWITGVLAMGGMNDMNFRDVNTGYLVGDSNRIYKTTNGANNWFQLTSGVSSNFVKIRMIDNNTGYVFGTSPTVILKTTNSGVNWLNLNTTITGYILDACFIDKDTGYVSNGSLHKTTNGGSTWNLVNTSPYLPQYISFPSARTGYFFYSYSVNIGPVIYDYNRVMKTTDYGQSWSTSYLELGVHAFGIKFIDDFTGWLLNWRAVVKTSNGGSTFINSNSKNIPENFVLSQNYPNPFNPSTKISYELKTAANIELNVYDANGRLTKILESGYKTAGNYHTNFSAEGLSSGVYYYSLYADGVLMDTKKAVVMK